MFALLNPEAIEDRPSVLRYFKVALILATITGLCLWRNAKGGLGGRMVTGYLPIGMYFAAATIGALIVGSYKAISLSRRLRHRSTNP